MQKMVKNLQKTKLTSIIEFRRELKAKLYQLSYMQKQVGKSLLQTEAISGLKQVGEERVRKKLFEILLTAK